MASTALAVLPADRSSEDRDVAIAHELVQSLRKEFDGRDRLYRRIDNVLYGGYDATIPKGYRKIGRPHHNPLAVYMTSTIAAALSVNPPVVQFPVNGIGDAAATNATQREHFFDASWIRQEEEADVPIFRRFTHSVVCKGEGILKTVPRSQSAWSDYTKYATNLTNRLGSGDLKSLDGDSKDRLYNAKTEEYKKTIAPYPIRSIDVDPSTFYYWKGEDGLTLAVEHKRVPYLETLVRYGQALDREGKVVPQGMAQALPAEEWRSAMSGTTHLTMDEVWSWDRVMYITAGPGQYTAQNAAGRGTMARSFRHRYGNPVTRSLRGPYAHCYGTTTSSRLPERAGLGVLYGFLDLFTMLDELLTIQQINAVITGLASFKRNAPPSGTTLNDTAYGEDGLPIVRQPVTIAPGEILPFDVGPIEMPRAGEALPATIAQIREFIELILPKVLQGVVDTTDSGYQLALASRLGRIAFDPMVSNMRRAAARRVGFESWLIEHEIGEVVYAEGTPVKRPGQRKTAAAGVLSIGPDDLNGQHRYRVHLQPEDKASELVEVRKHDEMVKAQFESRADAIEALGGNAEEVEVKIILETFKANPKILAQLEQRVLQKIAAKQDQQQQTADAALAQVAPPPQPGQQQPGAALGGFGNISEAGQGGVPFAPPGPGQPGMPAQQPGLPGQGGLPAGAGGALPPVGQQVAMDPSQAGLGMLGG